MALVVYQGPQQSTEYEGGSPQAERARYVGLTNQGATCYLNGLLQTLFMTPEFKAAIFKWKYDPSKDGDEEFCIPLQLQRLFGLLQLSKQRAVDTVGLTKSFGWEGFEVFQQQDVQELTRVLFDALEETFKGTEFEHIIDSLYAGELVDYLRCIDVDYQSERVDKFLDFSLAIVPFGSSIAMRSLTECIEMFLRPELLDGDNQYFCEKYDRKVDAIKGLKFERLPHIMSVQLKRFVYDFSGPSVVQKKINDEVRFPLVLDMNKYVSKKRVVGVDDMETEVVNEEFESFLRNQMEKLRAAHHETNHATAENGNHSAEASDQFLDNDLGSFADCREACDVPDPEVPLPSGEPQPDDGVFYDEMSSEQLEEFIASRGEWVYELYAVLIHSGAITGGHYYAYIKDLSSQRWYNFNDSTVTAIDIKTVQSAWGGKLANPSSTGFYPYKSSYYSSSSNAYMLMYRKVVKKETSAFVGDDAVPSYIHELVAAEEERRLKQQREEEELRSKLLVKVTFKGTERYISAQRTDKYKSLLERLFEVLDLKDVRDDSPEGMKEANGSYPLHLVRLRDYNVYTKTVQNAYDVASCGEKTLGELYFSDYRGYLLETRKPDEEWEVFYNDGFTLSVVEFDAERCVFKDPRSVRLPKYATMSVFRDLLQKLPGMTVPREHLRVLKLLSIGYQDCRFEIVEGDDRKLREELLVYDSMKIFVEDDRLCSGPQHSLAFEYFVVEKNRLDLHCSRPALPATSPTSPENTVVTADGRWKVGELRSRLATMYGLSVDRLRMFKQSLRGPELKDDSLTLIQAGLYNNVYISVAVGIAVPPGYFQVKLCKYMAKDIVCGIVPLPVLPPEAPSDQESAAPEFSLSLEKPPQALSEELDGEAALDALLDGELGQSFATAVAVEATEAVGGDATADAVAVAEAAVEASVETTATGLSDYVQCVVKNCVAQTQFELVEEVDDLHVNQNTVIGSLRSTITAALIAKGLLPPATDPRCVRLRDRYGCNPGRILRESKSFNDHQIYLSDHKVLAYEILPQPEVLDGDLSDTVVLCQQWIRQKAALSPRIEVLLPGASTIGEIARGLGAIYNIPVHSLRVLVVPRETEFYMYELAQQSPQRNYGRSWFNPMQENNRDKHLRCVSHDMRVQDGDLLIVQDASEPLLPLTAEDVEAIARIEASSHDPETEVWGLGDLQGLGYGSWPYMGATGTGAATQTGEGGGSYPTVKYARSVGMAAAGGIRIKTLKERQREEEQRRTEDSTSSSPVCFGPMPAVQAGENGTQAGRGSPVADKSEGGAAHEDRRIRDEQEFVKHGGMALFENLH